MHLPRLPQWQVHPLTLPSERPVAAAADTLSADGKTAVWASTESSSGDSWQVNLVRVSR